MHKKQIPPSKNILMCVYPRNKISIRLYKKPPKSMAVTKKAARCRISDPSDLPYHLLSLCAFPVGSMRIFPKRYHHCGSVFPHEKTAAASFFNSPKIVSFSYVFSPFVYLTKDQFFVYNILVNISNFPQLTES